MVETIRVRDVPARFDVECETHGGTNTSANGPAFSGMMRLAGFSMRNYFPKATEHVMSQFKGFADLANMELRAPFDASIANH
ncbi:MAG: hypothetical protein ACLFWD_02280 [Anaerolineales bacterium]